MATPILDFSSALEGAESVKNSVKEEKHVPQGLVAEALDAVSGNVVAPAVNAAFIEPWNTFNRKSMHIEPMSVSESTNRVQWAVQTMSGGLGAILPYVVAGKVAGGALRSTGSALEAKGMAAAFFKSEKSASIIGAAAYDAARTPHEGETRLGNSMAGAAGFAVFSYLNPYTHSLRFLEKGVARAAIGASGSTVQQLVSSAVARQELPEAASLKEAMLAGAVLNVGLPPTQHYLGKALNMTADAVNTRLGRGVPVHRFVESNYGAEPATKSPTFQNLLDHNPWTRVQHGGNETYALHSKRRIYLARGDGAEKLAHELFELSSARSPILEIGYKKAQALVSDSKSAPEAQRQSKLDEAWKAYEETRALKELGARSIEKRVEGELSGKSGYRAPVIDRATIETIGNSEIRPGFTYRQLWQQEFNEFVRLDGRFRPAVDYSGKTYDSVGLKTKGAVDEAAAAHDLKAGIEIIRALEAAGFEGYIVGGYVRNKLLGLPAKDIDISTSASPQEVRRVFESLGIKVFPKGEAFGVMSVIMKGVEYEIATFRTDGQYSDGRRPDSVKLGVPIQEDLARRDLTINAMAYNPRTGQIIDPFGGQKDIEARVLRAVGNPEERITEDPARMMRVGKFLSKLPGFRVDPDLRLALSLRHALIGRTANERVREEINGILTGKRPTAGLQLLMSTGLMKDVLPEVYALRGPKGWQDPVWHPEKSTWTHTKLVLDGLTGSGLNRMLGGLFHDIAKPHTQQITRDPDGRITKISNHGHDEVGADVTRRIMERLKYKTAETDHVSGLVRKHMFMHTVTQLGRGKLLALFERPDIMDLIELQHADATGTHKPDRMSKSNREFLLAELEKAKAAQDPAQTLGAPSIVDGNVLKELGFSNRDHFPEQGLRQGEHFRHIIGAAREAQMDGHFNDAPSARQWIEQNFDNLRKKK